MIKITMDKNIRHSVQQALKNNDGYCPCKIIKNADTKCMCKEFREQESGPCHCGLYYKE